MEKFLSQYLGLAKLNIFHKIHLWQGYGIAHPTWPVLEMFSCSMRGHLSLPWEDSELAGTSGSSNIHPMLVQPIFTHHWSNQSNPSDLNLAVPLIFTLLLNQSVPFCLPGLLTCLQLHCTATLQQRIVFKIAEWKKHCWCVVFGQYNPDMEKLNVHVFKVLSLAGSDPVARLPHRASFTFFQHTPSPCYWHIWHFLSFLEDNEITKTTPTCSTK